MTKYITPSAFIKETEGKKYDIDGAPKKDPYQCVDGIKEFTMVVYGKADFNCGKCGYAYGLWTNYGSNGVEKYFVKKKFKEAQIGDWIVWNWKSKDAPTSHVSMFYKLVSKTEVQAYGQNQNGKKYFNFANINTNGILGVLRPKIYDTVLPPKGYFGKGDQSKEVEKIDAWFANKVKGPLYGDYTEACVKVFQKQNGLSVNGKVDANTLAKMKAQGYK